jgi:hypothetical protein
MLRKGQVMEEREFIGLYYLFLSPTLSLLDYDL